MLTSVSLCERTTCYNEPSHSHHHTLLPPTLQGMVSYPPSMVSITCKNYIMSEICQLIQSPNVYKEVQLKVSGNPNPKFALYSDDKCSTEAKQASESQTIEKAKCSNTFCTVVTNKQYFIKQTKGTQIEYRKSGTRNTFKKETISGQAFISLAL